MTDRELLEQAAKAAGISGRYISSTKDIYQGIEHGDGYLTDRWCPLDDDGDALRLAVALRINIWLEKTLTIVEVCSDGDSENLIKKEYCDAETQMAATRRAIVRAAAEIGRNM